MKSVPRLDPRYARPVNAKAEPQAGQRVVATSLNHHVKREISEYC